MILNLSDGKYKTSISSEQLLQPTGKGQLFAKKAPYKKIRHLHVWKSNITRH